MIKRSEAIAFAATLHNDTQNETHEESFAILADLDERDQLDEMLLAMTSNFNLLAAAVADATGQTYDAVLADQLTKHLEYEGM